MRPAVTVLQLDTRFPRLPGDVACPETYRGEVELLRVPAATVGRVVSARPESIDIAPFEAALSAARGDIITTSCGFLSYWQTHLEARAGRPFVASALSALTRLDAAGTLTLTFDAASLTPRHVPGTMPDIAGLPEASHLRQVIARDLPDLDAARAGQEVSDLLLGALLPSHRAVLLECTNLPPYKPALRGITALPIHDILTELERLRPGTIAPDFL